MARASSDADVLVAGAGLAGLACAQALAGLGLRVLVLEAAARPGGRAASWPDPVTGQVVDIGAHVITSEHRNFLALLERLGTAGRILWQPQPLITLLDARRRLHMRASRLPPPLHGLVNLPAMLRRVSAADLLSNARVAWAAARLDEASLLALDTQDALHYLRRQGVSENFIRWFWTSAMLALLNVPLSACSAAAMMRLVRWLLGRSGYCFGFPSTGLAQMFVPGCRRAIEDAGGAVLTRAPVRRIVLDGAGRFAGFGLEDGRELRARSGVLALPPTALPILEVSGEGAASLCTLLRRARAFEPVRYLSTMLWFDRHLTHERFWSRVHDEQDLNTDFYDLSNIRDDLRGNGASLIVSNAIHAGAAWTWSDQAIVEKTRREIADFVGAQASPAALRHARVHRIPMAVPAPAPGTEALRPPCASGTPGLWLAGDWTATSLPCSMESAARSGALAAEAVAHAAGCRLRVAEPLPGTQAPFSWLGPRTRAPGPQQREPRETARPRDSSA